LHLRFHGILRLYSQQASDRFEIRSPIVFSGTRVPLVRRKRECQFLIALVLGHSGHCAEFQGIFFHLRRKTEDHINIENNHYDHDNKSQLVLQETEWETWGRNQSKRKDQFATEVICSISQHIWGHSHFPRHFSRFELLVHGCGSTSKRSREFKLSTEISATST